MSTGNVNIETGALNEVGKNVDANVAYNTRDAYNDVKQIAETVMQMWTGPASKTLEEKLNELDPVINRDISDLEELGGVLQQIAQNYEATEEENESSINKTDYSSSTRG